MRKSFFMLFTTMFIALFAASCGQSEYNELAQAPAPPTPTPTEELEPGYLDIVDGDSILRDSLGQQVTPRPERVVIALTAVPDTAKAAGAEGWSLLQSEANPKTPSYEGLGGSTSWGYNHGNVATEYSVYALYKGRKLPLWKPERLKEKQETLRTESDGSTYTVSDVRYLLMLGTQVLATSPQVLCTEVGYVPSWVCNQWFARHGAFNREATRSNNSVTVKCNNTATFWQLFDDNSHRDSLDVDYIVFNKFNMTIPEMEVEDKTTLYNKSFAFTAETATVQGNNVKAEWQSAAIENNILYNRVNYKDSIAPCVAYAKNLVFNADATAVTVYFFEKGVVSGEDYAAVTWPVTVKETVKFKELVKEFKHNAFRSNASVSGSNIAVLCDNTATFQKTYTNGSKDKAESVKYVVTNYFTYNMPANMPSEAKGKTYSFNGSTATVVSKDVTVSFSSRTIADIMFENVNYKGDKAVPQCEVAVKTIKFGESTAVITFTHDKETVTAEVPVSYEAEPTLKEIVREFSHGKFNTTGEVTGYTIKLTCSNPAHFYKLFTDGSKKDEKTFDFYEYNYFTYSMGEMPRGAKGNTYQFNGNTATVIGKSVTVTPASPQVVVGDIMYDGTNYKNDPKVPECKATVKSISFGETTATISFTHDSETITVTVPVSYEAEPTHDPDFPGRIVWGGAVDSYNSVPNGVYEWHGCYLMFLVEDNGVYTVHTRNINATSGWATYQINSNLAAMASNTTPLAYVGPNGEDAIGYLKSYDQGSWHKIVYYNADGSADKIIQEICKTIKGNNGNECRNPLRGVWSNGKITVDGKTYTITGSQD